jgi:hypothetical protein
MISLEKGHVQGKSKTLALLWGGPLPENIFGVHSLVDAFNAEHGTNLSMVKYGFITALTKDEFQQYDMLKYYRFPVDMVIACESADYRRLIRNQTRFRKKLGSEIIYEIRADFVCNVCGFENPNLVLSTGKYRGEEGALVALGINTTDIVYALDRRTRTLQETLRTREFHEMLDEIRHAKEIQLFIPDSRLFLVPDFPVESGFYVPDERTGVPHVLNEEYEGGVGPLDPRVRAFLSIEHPFFPYIGIPECYWPENEVFMRDSPGKNLFLYKDVPSGTTHKFYMPPIYSLSSNIDKEVVAEVPERDIAKIESIYEEKLG